MILSITIWWVLKSLTMIVDLSIFPFNSLNFPSFILKFWYQEPLVIFWRNWKMSTGWWKIACNHICLTTILNSLCHFVNKEKKECYVQKLAILQWKGQLIGFYFHLFALIGHSSPKDINPKGLKKELRQYPDPVPWIDS